MVTRGQRRLGRTIRNLENSVEFSAKECKAKESEQRYKKKIEQDFVGSPIENLRYSAQKKFRQK